MRGRPSVPLPFISSPDFLGRDGVFAALDLGTSTCRLLIAQSIGSTYRVFDAFSRIVRLGEGLQTTGFLSDAAQERALAALSICADKMRLANVAVVRAVTTEACRRAKNAESFIEKVRERTGITLEPITPIEEARLGITGCASLLDKQKSRVVVFDIGGGSTEVCWADIQGQGRFKLRDQMSVSQGVVTLSERFGGDDVDDQTFESMVATVLPAFAAFDVRTGISGLIRAGRVQMVGTSGTTTTLAAAHLCLPRYDRQQVDGLRLPFAVMRHRIDLLRGQDEKTRAENPCIGPDRARMVVAGCAILEALWRVWPADMLRIGDRGLREGILMDLWMRHFSA